MADSKSKNWTCPFCNRPQTLTSGQERRANLRLQLAEHKHGEIGLVALARACANPDCCEATVNVLLCSGTVRTGTYEDVWSPTDLISTHILRPQGTAKPQPEYIPPALREDYVEACLIRDQSPKASATLARRCLQGMIRDFAKISGKTLFAEIKALRQLVSDGKAPSGISQESVEAIDHVRSIGNIGAHMEKDIDLIVPVDAGEAQALIELIELLFEEWYVARDVRSKKLERVKQIAQDKAVIKQGAGDNEPDGG